MACANCGSTILFGGKKSGNRKYCNEKCFEADEIGRMSDAIPDSEVDRFSAEIRQADCPQCGKNSGLEVFKSYFIYSVILFTSWKQKPELSCRSCARKRQLKDFFASSFLGWWGIPFGILITPIILVANVVAMIINPLHKQPSKKLKEYARLLIAQDILSRQEK